MIDKREELGTYTIKRLEHNINMAWMLPDEVIENMHILDIVSLKKGLRGIRKALARIKEMKKTKAVQKEETKNGGTN